MRRQGPCTELAVGGHEKNWERLLKIPNFIEGVLACCMTAILFATDSIFSFLTDMEDSLALRNITKATINITVQSRAEGDNDIHLISQLC